MNTFSIKLFLRPPKTQPGKFTVYCRILYNRKKADFSTGIKCREEEWDELKEKFHNKSHLNQRLSQLQEKIYRVKHDLDEKGADYSARDVVKEVNGGVKKAKRGLLEFFEEHIERRKNDPANTRATIKKYQQTYRYMEDFLLYSRKSDCALSGVDLALITEFDDYLKQRPKNIYGDSLTKTTVNKHHSRLKAVLNDAIRRDLYRLNPYLHFKLSFPDSNREYLTKDEVERIWECNLEGNKSLEKTRDIFLFSCYTGLRFQDAMNMTMRNIAHVGNNLYLRVDQQKTGERREIPLLDKAEEIIHRNTLSDERRVLNKILPQLSNQKVNQYLKIIADLADIHKPLTHHIARHTCATTILLDNGVSLETVSHWLGHNSVRTTQKYAKISHAKLTKESRRLNEILNVVANSQ